ncbi:MAG: capsular biosynthesis protein [Betaproteobacteria bacterium]|nr:capsular biosynthesis protein [Betaproteobacteria bacterium]
MIDLHCHLLPGVDDGPATMDEAIAMARAALANGIGEAVLTPHIYPERFGHTRSSLQAPFAAFQAELKRQGVGLRVHLGGEVRCSEDIITLVEREEIPFIGRQQDYWIMLLEFPHSHIPVGAYELVKWLMQNRIRPLIAHPERNRDVMRSLDKIRPFVQAGCMLQVTASSLIGGFGDEAFKRAWEMFDHGWVTLLATDAHNLVHRPPDLASGRRAIELAVGEDAAYDYVYHVPGRILGRATH